MTHLKQIIESMESGDMRSMGSSVHDLVAQKCQERFKPIYEGVNIKAGEIKKVELDAARWNDVNGNTYHTVIIKLNDKVFDIKRNVYGYERHFEQTALESLQAAKLIPADVSSISAWARENKIELISDVVDKKLKRQMVNY